MKLSYSSFLNLLVTVIFLGLLLGFGDNSYINLETIIIIFLQYLLLILFNNKLINKNNALLNTFLITFVIFWYFGYLTLLLWPDASLVLQRTININSRMFGEYAWAVLFSFLTISIAILLPENIFKKKYSIKNAINIPIKDDNPYYKYETSKNIFIYILLAFFYQIIVSTYTLDALPLIFGYMSFIFSIPLMVFLLLYDFFESNGKFLNKYTIFVLIMYLIYTALMGSRGVILAFIMYGMIFFFSYGIKIEIRVSTILKLITLFLLMLVVFVFGTFQRQLRDDIGTSVDMKSIEYFVDRVESSDLNELVESTFSLASARARYLDFSAEMYLNPAYESVININNEIKSTIDGYIPGKVFEESDLVSLRVKDVYAPNFVGYQSDALGVVGENFLLFGNFFYIAIFFFVFGLSAVYQLQGISLFNSYIKYSLCIWLYTWLNSFGYDWLFLDIGRQVIFGYIVIKIIQKNNLKI